MRHVFPRKDNRVDVFAHEWFVFDHRQGRGGPRKERCGGEVSHPLRAVLSTSSTMVMIWTGFGSFVVDGLLRKDSEPMADVWCSSCSDQDRFDCCNTLF